MNCNRLRLGRSFSEQSGFSARLLLHWHLLNCSVCRAERTHEKTTISQLRQLAEATPSEALRQRTLASFPTFSQPTGIPGMGVKAKNKMKRLTYVGICAALLIVVTGALAGKFFFQPSSGCTDRLGRNWNITGAYHGEVEIIDSNGKPAGDFSMEFGEMKESIVIEVAGERFQIQGVGKHEILGKNSLLYGYAVLKPLTKEAFLARMHSDHYPSPQEALDSQAADWANPNWNTHNGTSGVENFPWGVRGFDATKGLRWKLSGRGSIRAYHGNSAILLASGSATQQVPLNNATMPLSLQRLLDANEPEITASIGDKIWNEKGFGKHEFKNEKGEVLLTIEAKPLIGAR